MLHRLTLAALVGSIAACGAAAERAPQQADKAPPPAPPAPEPEPKFKKGDHPEPGMTAAEVEEYATAQGDPMKGTFTLQQALAGDAVLSDPAGGDLTALFETSMGRFECRLFEQQAPKTVANFVGLARGTRPSFDRKADAWVKKRFFDGVIFYRVVKGFVIQTGDPTGGGSGGPGYVIVDEIDASLKHDKPGALSMANRGPNNGSSHFFVTLGAAPKLDGKHALFGRCDTKVPKAIGNVRVEARKNHRPVERVILEKVTIERREN